jgi:putative CocE/NonD family hydrolase
MKPESNPENRPTAAVKYFSMGDNVWKFENQWPPPGSTATSFYLHSNGHANTKGGDGSIDQEATRANEPGDSFRADPADPTPACPVTSSRPLGAPTWAPVDQRPTEDRKDVLVYTSQPLSVPLTFAGNPKVELFVSADTPDADWVAKLVDVHPDGAAYNLAVGILRGRFRDSEMQATPLTPGQVYKITIDLGPVAAQLAKDHRLRLDISGAYFPLFDRNPNTGEGPFSEKNRVSTETVHHSATELSRIVLPCLK